MPSSDPGDDRPPPPFEQTERIGPYRLLRVLGEGGMGVVFEAEQLEPIHRRVAIKILRRGLDTRDVLARFDAERQALAVMDHPAIARIFDAGVNAEGRPYFVMELVKGISLVEYCDARRLTVRERVALLAQVAEAVQHAHQKGIIHRDLKPSNVLVAEDGVALPKIIDFGIAKAISQRLTERTLITGFGESMGTPAYMSPEQAERSGLDVDTRADIYSLGIVLYEVLVSRLPADPNEMGLANFITQLTLGHNEPPRPSVRVTRMGDATAAADFRRTTVEGLRRQLRGDLDWIVMKAIEKDRTRRFQTANDLAKDLRHYLSDEPVMAGPPGARYRIGKFVRRNRVAVAASLLVMLSIVTGMSLAALGLVRARHAETVARREAATAGQVSGFLVDLFGVTNPETKRGGELTARELLDSGATRVLHDLQAQPIVQARLLRSIGNAYVMLGLYDQATAVHARALQLRQSTEPLDSAAIAESLLDLGKTNAVRGSLAPAESLVQASLTIRERSRPSSDSAVGTNYVELARIHFLRADLPRARAELRSALLHYDKANGAMQIPRLNALSFLATTYAAEGQLDTAAMQFRRVLGMAEPEYGLRHAVVIGAHVNLAIIARRQNRFAEAETLLTRVLPGIRSLYGERSARYATALHNLGSVYLAENRLSDAEFRIKEAVAISERIYTADSPDLASQLASLAEVYAHQGRLRQADSLYRRALAIQEKVLKPGAAELTRTRSSYVGVLKSLGRNSEAIALEKRIRQQTLAR